MTSSVHKNNMAHDDRYTSVSHTMLTSEQSTIIKHLVSQRTLNFEHKISSPSTFFYFFFFNLHQHLVHLVYYPILHC